MIPRFECYASLGLVILTFQLYSVEVHGQLSNHSYEDIALSFFLSDIAEDYNDLNYLLFDGRLEQDKPLPYGQCSSKNLYKVDWSPEGRSAHSSVLLLEKRGLIRTLFSRKSKYGRIYVTKAYQMGEDMVVQVQVAHGLYDDFYSIRVVQSTRKVHEYCLKEYVH